MDHLDKRWIFVMHADRRAPMASLAKSALFARGSAQSQMAHLASDSVIADVTVEQRPQAEDARRIHKL